MIRSVILTRSFHLLINPAVANQQTWRTRLEWLGISVVVLGLAFTLTLFIRFLGLMSILNGLLALLTSIALPVVLYILCCKKRKTLGKIPKPEWAVMVLILLLCLATIVAYVVLIVQRAVLSEGGGLQEYHGAGTGNTGLLRFQSPALGEGQFFFYELEYKTICFTTRTQSTRL